MKKLSLIVCIMLSVMFVSAQQADTTKADTTYLNNKAKALIESHNQVSKKLDELQKQANELQKQLVAIEGALQMVAIMKEEQVSKSKPKK